MKLHLLQAALLVLIALFWAGSASGGAMDPVHFDSDAKAAQYRTLLHELRCTVCQNQSLADSNADLASDLRRQVFELVDDGATNAQVIDYMVARYGDFVLYRPPLRPSTYVLWLGPFGLLILGIFIWYQVSRGTEVREPQLTTSPEGRQRAGRLLRGEES
ncbi:cytochrome c-type biogenesis protein CcmH [Natronocella acetinitrilica]|uniref:Cytochrome c-type biogenesis protein n=1 Tax=Natronocella acetinitrilica TaxID=414046 RepID=A0AAE3G7K9_9GAMM|nr:cytochrome c-type biogenesis protein CcmH [Natronocella acetinitrilica]